MPDLWGLASIIAKFALYLGVLTSVGTVLNTLMFRLAGTRRLAAGFATLGLFATLFGFMLAGAMLTGDASGMTDPEMLALLWSTPVGTAFALRVMGLGLLIVGLFIGRLGVALTLIGSALTLWSFTLTGHIPTLDNPMLNALLLFHLVAISFWIGVLTPLRALASDASKIATATALGARFGKRAAAFVPLLIIAGVFMTYTLVGSVSALFRSSYGQALLLKVLLVAGLLGLAAANKLRFIPQMAKGDTAAAKHLAKSISLEWIVIAAVLLTTAVLTSVLTLPN